MPAPRPCGGFQVACAVNRTDIKTAPYGKPAKTIQVHLQKMKTNALPIGKLNDQDLRLLRIFKSVADSGGMSQAELSLNLSLSTISRHIKDLEIRLGLVLCRRGRQGFELTPEGREVYQAALQLMDATDTFRHAVSSIKKNIGGELNIALFENTVSNPNNLLPQALHRFHNRSPATRLHLHTGTIAAIERSVLDDTYHIGVIPQHRRSDILSYEYLFDEQMYLYAGRGHEWYETDCLPDWHQLHGQTLVGLDCHSPNSGLFRQHQLHKTMLAADQEAVAMLILSGVCIGFLPEHYANRFTETGQMRAVHPERLQYVCRFFAITRKNGLPNRLTEMFMEDLLHTYRPSE